MLTPDLTVAAVVERAGRFLLVEEHVARRLVLNQPAGHVEPGEPLIEASIRETLEETAWHFTPEALVGIYLWSRPDRQRTFLRFAFCGQVTDHEPERPLDHGIQRAVWLTRAELQARSAHLRSPMVLKCIDDYFEGRRYSLDIVREIVQDPIALATAARPHRLRDLPNVQHLS